MCTFALNANKIFLNDWNYVFLKCSLLLFWFSTIFFQMWQETFYFSAANDNNSNVGESILLVMINSNISYYCGGFGISQMGVDTNLPFWHFFPKSAWNLKNWVKGIALNGHKNTVLLASTQAAI